MKQIRDHQCPPGIDKWITRNTVFQLELIIELKACPEGSLPTRSQISSGSYRVIATVRLNALEIDWIEKHSSLSPA